MLRHLLLIGLCSSALTMTHAASAQPVITDSRVKTLVYNANDVYSLVTHHGYQANIEFSADESIRTISVGDRTSWQIIGDGRRLFLRSLVASAHTNMTVITNARTYNFDIRSTGGGALPVREDLVYMARFYYPDDHIPRVAAPRPPVYADQMVAAMPASTPAQYAQPAAPATMPALNFQYTFTGDDALAPEKVFDDGNATYMRLGSPAQISYINQNGQPVAVTTSMTSDGFTKVPLIAAEFAVTFANGMSVQVYNEQLSQGGM